MSFELEALKATRINIKKAISNLTVKELNTIPSGFSNSIIWNVGHVIVTQQLLHYKMSGLNPLVDEELINRYKKGTVPTDNYTPEDEIKRIKSLLENTLEWLKQDIDAGNFKTFDTYETSYGITLNSFDQALYFITVHEGLHLGYIMAMRKSI